MKRRFEPTRKRRALRNCVIFLLLIVVCNTVFGRFFLLPGQVRRQSQDYYETGATHVIWRDMRTQRKQLHYRTLSENENAALLTDAWLTPSGWIGGSTLLDCVTEPAPWHIAEHYGEISDDRYQYTLFARLDDAKAETVTVHVGFETLEYLESDSSRYVWGPVDGGATLTAPSYVWCPVDGGVTLTASRADWLVRDGRRYVLLQTELPVPETQELLRLASKTTLFDENGGIIDTARMGEQGARP